MTKRLTLNDIKIIGEEADRLKRNKAIALRDQQVRKDAAASTMLAALRMAENALSRAPFSTQTWPNGVHPHTGIETIRTAMAAAEAVGIKVPSSYGHDSDGTRVKS